MSACYSSSFIKGDSLTDSGSGEPPPTAPSTKAINSSAFARSPLKTLNLFLLGLKRTTLPGSWPKTREKPACRTMKTFTGSFATRRASCLSESFAASPLAPALGRRSSTQKFESVGEQSPLLNRECVNSLSAESESWRCLPVARDRKVVISAFLKSLSNRSLSNESSSKTCSSAGRLSTLKREATSVSDPARTTPIAALFLNSIASFLMRGGALFLSEKKTAWGTLSSEATHFRTAPRSLSVLQKSAMTLVYHEARLLKEIAPAGCLLAFRPSSPGP